MYARLIMITTFEITTIEKGGSKQIRVAQKT